jgi:hypothetical protein
MTTPTDEDLKNQGKKAEEAVLVGGQSYTIGPRQTSMPNLKDLTEYTKLQAHLAERQVSGNGGFGLASLKGA